MEAFVEKLERLWEEAAEIWVAGGPAMVAIAAIALVMFGVGMSLWLRLRAKGVHSAPEKTWRHWIHHPGERRGPIGGLLDFVTGAGSLEETGILFRQLRASEIAPFQRDLRVMTVCVSAAPLVGLLGTVTGMLSTFGALATGSGGEKTMALVAEGISEALITTETGLIVALPGLFFQYQLVRKHERYKAFLAHLETVCTQTTYRKNRLLERIEAQRRTRAPVREAARRQIAELIRDRLNDRQRSVVTRRREVSHGTVS